MVGIWLVQGSSLIFRFIPFPLVSLLSFLYHPVTCENSIFSTFFIHPSHPFPISSIFFSASLIVSGDFEREYFGRETDSRLALLRQMGQSWSFGHWPGNCQRRTYFSFVQRKAANVRYRSESHTIRQSALTRPELQGYVCQCLIQSILMVT